MDIDFFPPKTFKSNNKFQELQLVQNWQNTFEFLFVADKNALRLDVIENVTHSVFSKRIVKTYRGIKFGSYGRVFLYHAILDSGYGLRGTEMTDYRVTGRKGGYQKL